MSSKSTGCLKKEIFGALTQQLHAKPSCGRSISRAPEGTVWADESGTRWRFEEETMRGTGAVAAKGLTALICSLLMVFQPILGAPTPLPTGAVNRGRQVQAAGARARAGTIVETMPFLLLFLSFPEPVAESTLIAVAKLTGTVDRNGQPLVNGSIVSSGDLLSTHGDSALLLSSA